MALDHDHRGRSLGSTSSVHSQTPHPPPNHHKFFKHPPKPIFESVWRGCTFSGQGDFEMKWILTSTFVVLMILTQGSAVAFSPGEADFLDLAEKSLADEEPVEAACLLPGAYVETFSCTTGSHVYKEGMVQELTGLSVSDVGGSARSIIDWDHEGNQGSLSLDCEWAYAGGETLPACNESGPTPPIGAQFEHRCSMGRSTAGVALCSIRVDPTA